jgi:hypothetical protein
MAAPTDRTSRAACGPAAKSQFDRPREMTAILVDGRRESKLRPVDRAGRGASSAAKTGRHHHPATPAAASGRAAPGRLGERAARSGSTGKYGTVGSGMRVPPTVSSTAMSATASRRATASPCR